MAEPKLEVRIDGKKVPANQFVRKVFVGVVESLVTPLKGVENPKEIVITVRRE